AEVGAPAAKDAQRDRVEPGDLGVGVAELVEVAAAQAARAHRVEEEPHADAVLGALREELDETAAEMVGLPDVVLEVNVVRRRLDRGADRRVGRGPVGVELERLGAERRRLAGVDADTRELAVLVVCRAGVEGADGAQRLGDELAGAPPPRLLPLEAERADEAIDREPADGHEYEDEEPGDGGGRRAPLEDDHHRHREAPRGAQREEDGPDRRHASLSRGSSRSSATAARRSWRSSRPSRGTPACR